MCNNLIDLVGTTIDMLHVDSYVGKYVIPGHKKPTNNYSCTCRCGNVIIRSRAYLRDPCKSVVTKSCGCAQLKHIDELADTKRGSTVTHGLSNTRIYKTYMQMHHRCYYKTAINYNRYGGRGIYICDEWNRFVVGTDIGFKNFYNWSLKNGYAEQPHDVSRNNLYTIDRKDSNGPYAPRNCRWVISDNQVFNRRNTWTVNLDGSIYPVSAICRITGQDIHKYCGMMRAKKTLWSDYAIVYRLLHPELSLHMDHSGTYRDKNGYIVLINMPKIKRELNKLFKENDYEQYISSPA